MEANTQWAGMEMEERWVGAWEHICHEDKNYLQSSLWAERPAGGEREVEKEYCY